MATTRAGIFSPIGSLGTRLQGRLFRLHFVMNAENDLLTRKHLLIIFLWHTILRLLGNQTFLVVPDVERHSSSNRLRFNTMRGSTRPLSSTFVILAQEFSQTEMDCVFICKCVANEILLPDLTSVFIDSYACFQWRIYVFISPSLKIFGLPAKRFLPPAGPPLRTEPKPFPPPRQCPPALP